MDGYCSAVNLPTSASDFAETLRQKFTKLAKRVDKAQTEASDLYFDADGKPHLRQLTRLPDPEEAEQIEAIMKSRMTERHLLDVLYHVHHMKTPISLISKPAPKKLIHTFKTKRP